MARFARAQPPAPRIGRTKAGSGLVTILSSLVPPGPVITRSFYTTTFPLTENPISESNLWTVGGRDGVDWTDVRTTTNKAFGTQSGSSSAQYDDSIATVRGVWSKNQRVRGVVVNTGGSGDFSAEVELLMRFTINAHSTTGYEINFSANPSNGYATIVRWDGALGLFTTLQTQFPGAVATGDVLEATVIGNTITGYINGTSVVTATDSTLLYGNPGIGFFLKNRTASGVASDYGFSSFTAGGDPINQVRAYLQAVNRAGTY